MKKILLCSTIIVSSLLFSSGVLAQPPAVAAVAAAAMSYAAGTKFVILGLTTLQTAILVGVATLALGYITQALAPSPPTPDFSGFVQQQSQGRSRQIQQPITSRKIVYGEQRTSGPLVFAESTNSNKFLHLVICVASHEVDGIPIVFLNEYPIYEDMLDGNGKVISGDYANKVRIKKHLGADDQTADSALVNETSFTSNHRLRGIAYLYIRLEFDQDLFPTKIPDISVWLRGKKVKEIRDSAQPTQFSVNPALCIRDYLTTSVINMGAGFLETEIDDDLAESSANESDEVVTTQNFQYTASSVNTTKDTIEFPDEVLRVQTGDQVEVSSTDTLPTGLAADTNYYVIASYPYKNDVRNAAIKLAASYDDALAGTAIDITGAGSGTLTVTKNGEPRYTLNGVVDSARRPFDIIKDMLTSMGGRAIYTGGKWGLLAAVYNAPTESYDESDIIDVVDIQTRHSRRERFNAVKGTYVDPANLWVVTEYPEVTNSLYESEDNGEQIYIDIDLPFTTRHLTAERLAKVELERHRQQLTVSARFKLTALRSRVGDVIQLSNTRMGWENKEFEVVEWEFGLASEEEAPLLVIDMTLRETASGVYDWNMGEETTRDLAANSNLPNPFVASQPTGFMVSTEEVISSAGTPVSQILLNWNKFQDHYVSQDGRVEVQFRKSSSLEDLTDGRASWIKTSESALNEYYLELSTLIKPFELLFNSVVATEGTLGELAQGEWAYGDQDNLGFETIYVRLADDTDPDDSANTVEAKFFRPSFFVAGSETEAYIPAVEDGVNYDVRIRAVNYIGVRSDWLTVRNYTIGSGSAGVSDFEDWGLVKNNETAFEDWGSVTDPNDSTLITEDWGEF